MLILAAVPRSGLTFAQPAGSGVISGTVVEASNNEPVRKAIVTLTWQGSPRAWATSRTDTSGQFKFEGLPAGKFDLRATKTGEGTAIYGAASVRELGELIALEDRETRAGVKLRFLRSATISGRVLDPHGDPAVEVSVALLRPGHDLGERVLIRDRGTSTNERGEYRLDDVAPGRYYLHAEQHFELAGAEPLSKQFLGGARESKDARILEIRGGEPLAGVDFHMTSEPAVHVHGRVTGLPETAHDAEGLTIMLSPADEYVENWYGIPYTNLALGNAFSFDLNPGRYRVDASVEIEGKAWTASKLVDTHEAPDEIVLAVAPARDIQGKLRIEGPAGPLASNFGIRLWESRGRPIISANVGTDGTFTLKQVPPGEWVLEVVRPGVFLKMARFGDQDIRFARMEVKPGAEDSISIVVSTNSAQVHGEVDAAGADSKRAGVLLAPTGQSSTITNLFYSGAADDSGKFELKGIAPGKYRIFALERLSPGEFKTPEAAAQLGPLGEEIDLAEGAAIEVHPKLIPVERAREALP